MKLSFSNDVKKELCSNTIVDGSQLRAELYAMLLLANIFTPRKIELRTESKYTAIRFSSLLTMLFNPIIEKRDPGQRGKYFSIIVIDENECKKIFDFYGHETRELSIRVNRAFVDSQLEMKAFLRGVFLAVGSVADPLKSYHLELCIPRKNLSLDICRIVREIDDTVINIKLISRKGSYMAYLKDSEQITDFLVYIGATNAAMNIMGTKALKEVRNRANRKANSEYANLQKQASASALQIKAINKLKQEGKFLSLPNELKEIATIRIEQPGLSLREIGEMLDPPLSRSGVNHRLEKIIRMSGEKNE